MGLLLLRSHDRPLGAWLEENGTGTDGESQRKKREERERNDLGWKKTERGKPTGSPYPVNSSFRSPLTGMELGELLGLNLRPLRLAS